MTTTRATKSRLPFQKKGKTSFTNSACTHKGLWIMEATHHTLDRAKALITRALPRKNKERCRHNARTFSTAVIRGCQLSSSRSLGLINTAKTLIFSEVQSSWTGGSCLPLQEPSQRSLDLETFSLAPDAASNKECVKNCQNVVVRVDNQ